LELGTWTVHRTPSRVEVIQGQSFYAHWKADKLLHELFYKLCLIMHSVHTNRAPQYLSECVQTVVRSSNRPGLRSSYTAAYAKPRCRTKFGERGFRHAGPTAWNSLPDHLHQINETSLFKRRLKTTISQSILSLVSVSAPGRPVASQGHEGARPPRAKQCAPSCAIQ